jgi:hypothetical protein
MNSSRSSKSEERKMPRFEDFRSDPEVRDIVEKLAKKFPRVFEGFTVGDVGFIVTMKKKLKGKHPIKVRAVAYPHFVFSGKTYVMEVFETKWEKLNKKQKNLAVFHSMCSIPVGGFDPGSTMYGRVLKADYELFRMEYAAAGGVADWFEDDRARDPMEIEAAELPSMEEGNEDPIPVEPAPGKGSKRPVTASDIADVDAEPDDEVPKVEEAEAVAS